MSKKVVSKKSLLLLLTLTVLTLLAGGYVVGGTRAYSSYRQSVLTKGQHCGGQAPVHICIQSPSTIFSAFYRSYTATQYQLFTVNYSSDTPKSLLITVTINGFSQPQTQAVNAISTIQARTFVPVVKPQALAALTTTKQTTLHVQVTDNEKQSYYVSDTTLSLYSRQLMQWNQANRLKIGAWVTPNNAAINTLLERAQPYLDLQQQPSPTTLAGYTAGSPQETVDQVDAIYDALHTDYAMQYVPATVPYNSSGKTTKNTQVIKLPDEVLQQHSGNCIELTLLLATAAERIGLHTEIVIVSGHALLGVATTSDNQNFEYWDSADMTSSVASGETANIDADTLYRQHELTHTITDTILVSDARNARIEAML